MVFISEVTKPVKISNFDFRNSSMRMRTEAFILSLET